MRLLFLILFCVSVIPLASSYPRMPGFNQVLEMDMAVPQEVLSQSSYAAYVQAVKLGDEHPEDLIEAFVWHERRCNDLDPFIILVEPSSEEIEELEPIYDLIIHELVKVPVGVGAVEKKMVYAFFPNNYEDCYDNLDSQTLYRLLRDGAEPYRKTFDTAIPDVLVSSCQSRIHCSHQVLYDADINPEYGFVIYVISPESENMYFSKTISNKDVVPEEFVATERFRQDTITLSPDWYLFQQGSEPVLVQGVFPHTAQKTIPEEETDVVETHNQTSQTNQTHQSVESIDPNSPHLPQPPVMPEEINDSLVDSVSKDSWWQLFAHFFSSLFS